MCGSPAGSAWPVLAGCRSRPAVDEAQDPDGPLRSMLPEGSTARLWSLGTRAAQVSRPTMPTRGSSTWPLQRQPWRARASTPSTPSDRARLKSPIGWPTGVEASAADGLDRSIGLEVACSSRCTRPPRSAFGGSRAAHTRAPATDPRLDCSSTDYRPRCQVSPGRATTGCAGSLTIPSTPSSARSWLAPRASASPPGRPLTSPSAPQAKGGSTCRADVAA